MAAQDYTEAWLTGPQSTQFYTRTYLPPAPAKPKAVVVYVHGFAEHVGRYTHFHPAIAKRGVAVFAFDQRGFGLTALDTTGKKSKTSAWAKTSWSHQMEDIDWAIKHAKQSFENTPIFLAGHSMGGGETLGFVCQEDKSPYKVSASLLSGAISTSPLIMQAKPAPKFLKWLGGKLSVLSPNTLIPAGVKPEELSHDETFNTAYMKDPLIKQTGSLRGVFDMLTRGEELIRTGYRRWPTDVPLLLIHGTDDRVTDHKSSEQFVNLLPEGCKKKLSLVSGGFHELQNEPDGVKERVADEIVRFIEEHIPPSSTTRQTAIEGTGPSASTASLGVELTADIALQTPPDNVEGTTAPPKANL